MDDTADRPAGSRADIAARIHYIALRMRAADARLTGRISAALAHERDSDLLLRDAARADFDADAWEAITSDVDDIVATGASTGQEWAELIDRAFTL